MKDMIEIWNDAYNLYIDTDYHSMCDYLKEEIENGNLTQGDATTIAEDVVETADL